MVAYRYALTVFALSSIAPASSFTALIKHTHLDDPTPTETPDYVPDYDPLADDPYYDPIYGTDTPGWTIITDEPLPTEEPTTTIHLTTTAIATATTSATETSVFSVSSAPLTSSLVPALSSTTHDAPSTTSYLPVDPKISASRTKDHHKNLVVTMTLVAIAVFIAVGIVGLACGMFIYNKIHGRKARKGITEIVPERSGNTPPTQSPRIFAAPAPAPASAFNTRCFTLGIGGPVTPIQAGNGMEDIELVPMPILHDPRISDIAQREHSASRHSELPVPESGQERMWWQGSVSQEPCHSLRHDSSAPTAFSSRRPTRAESLTHSAIPTGSTTIREEPVSPLSSAERQLFESKSSRNSCAMSIASSQADSFNITPVTVTSHGRAEDEYVPPRQGWSAV